MSLSDRSVRFRALALALHSSRTPGPRARQLRSLASGDGSIALHSLTRSHVFLPIDAGNVIAHVKSSEPIKILTVRATAFPKAAASGGSASSEEVEAIEDAPEPTKFLSTSEVESARPDLASASKVVAGGRALKSKETFAEIMEPLADALGAGAPCLTPYFPVPMLYLTHTHP